MRLIVATTIALCVFASADPLSAQIPTPLPSAQTLDDRRAAVAAELGTEFVADVRAEATSTTPTKRWLPFRSQEAAAAFWGQDQADFLASGTVLFEDKVFESTLELVSDVVGWFRVGVGVTVAASRDGEDPADGEAAEQAETLGRLANSGGVLQVSAVLPLLYRTQPQFNSTWALVWTQHGGTEAPSTGSFLEGPAATYQTGLEWMYDRKGVDRRIDLQWGVVARGYWFNDAMRPRQSLMTTWDSCWCRVSGSRFWAAPRSICIGGRFVRMSSMTWVRLL